MRDTTCLERIGLALRTAMACLIVSLTTLYGPKQLTQFTKFPAFAYLTTILIWLSDAEPTYGEVLKSCVDVSYATFQTLAIVLVSVLVVGPASLGNSLVAPVAVAIASFIVAFPASTSLLTKRIAFGQIVVVYVTFVVFKGEVAAHVVMLPVHVAASTALGAIASLLSVLLPFPRLAHSQVNKSCKLYAENALERLNLFVEVMMARDNTTAQVLIRHVASLSAAARKTLKNIKIHQERMAWERPDTRFLRRKQKHLDHGEKLQATEFLMKGMEMALGSCTSFPLGMSRDELTRLLEGPRTQIAPESASSSTLKSSQENLRWQPEADSLSTAALPVCFFRYCVKLFRGDFVNRSHTEEEETQPESKDSSMTKRVLDILCVWMARERFVFAIKCSISLGLAVLFGIMYNKKNGYWSGLTVAISLVTGRQATLTVANSRLQGTAMGSVYALLCCSVFQRLEEFRFLPLLPWIAVTVFMRHSKVYGQPGGVTAAIAALLILGRRNYGAPTEFAITRIVEASIGLLCFVFGEILITPARAATLARTEVSHCLDAVLDCIQSLVLCSEQKKSQEMSDLRRKQANLKSHVEALERFTAEALTEPNLPFLRPLNAVSYSKLLGSFSKISDLCLYLCDDLKNLSGFPLEHITQDLKSFQEKLHSSVNSLEEITSTKSLARLQKELQKRKICHDVEAGTTSDNEYSLNMELGPSQDDEERFSASFVTLLKEATNKISGSTSTAEEAFKSETALRLSSLGFCISRLMQETICLVTEIAHTT